MNSCRNNGQRRTPRLGIALVLLATLGCTGCRSYKVVMDSDYTPETTAKKKVSILGVIAPENKSGGFFLVGHSRPTNIEQETLNLLADKMQRYFNESPYFTTYDKVDLERLVDAQKLQASDLFDRTGEILPNLGSLQQVDCIVIARITLNSSMAYLAATWWNTIEIELKMVDVKTSQVYLSGYAGGRWFFPFSNELSFEGIFERLFEELSEQIEKRREQRPAPTTTTERPPGKSAKASAG